MFQIHQINASPDSLEYLGTKRKFWYAQGADRYLFKAEERGTGEDWAEKVVCELARLLGLPHVEYDLAHYQPENLPGVICPNITPRPLSLIMGNQIMVILDEAYPATTRKKFGVPKYTVEAVARVLRILRPPPSGWMANAPTAVTSAMGVFAGYMMLDAWVANQDRHHENWAAVLNHDHLALSPTFDHGSALARNLTDKERQDRLTTKDQNRTVKFFVERAVSEFFPADGTKPLPLMEVFKSFAALAPVEIMAWLGRLEAVTPAQVQAILAQVPPERMSQLTRQFTLELLTVNRIRLLKEYQP